MEDYFKELHQKLDAAKMEHAEKNLYKNARELFEDLAGGFIDLSREESDSKDAGKKFADMDFAPYHQRYTVIGDRADVLFAELAELEGAGESPEYERLLRASQVSYTAFLQVIAAKLKALDVLIRRGKGEKISGFAYRKDVKAFDRAHNTFGNTLDELEDAYREYLDKFID